MKIKAKKLGAAAAKTQFLSLLDTVEAKRTPYIVTKNGREVAQIIPMPLDGDDPIFGFYPRLDILGDVLSPMYSDKEWEEFLDLEAINLQ